MPINTQFVQWFRIGVNLKGFSLNLSSIAFHLGLGAIFSLYGCFFVQLNMFTTLKWLAAAGTVVYMSGHSLLSNRLKLSKKEAK